MNLYDFTTPEKGELFDTLLEDKNIKIVRIVSSGKPETKEYCQEEDEWVIVLEGSAILLLSDREIDLKKGDSVFIPSKTKHKVLHTSKGTLWLAVHIT